jgi:hypothetical protein
MQLAYGLLVVGRRIDQPPTAAPLPAVFHRIATQLLLRVAPQ